MNGPGTVGSSHRHHVASPPSRSRPRAASRAALLALLLLVQLATSLYQLPLTRLIERRLCDDFYRGKQANGSSSSRGWNFRDIDESLCKVDAVQQQLAWVLGAMDTAWIVGDFIMAIPLGFVAEALGQRAVLWLNLVPRIFMLTWAPIIGLGFGETLPISAVVAAPFLSFLGGDCVFGSITYSLAAGSTDDYVSRATLFGYMSSITYVTNLLGPGVASATMGTALWLPFVIGICLLLLAIPTIALLPGAAPSSVATIPLSSHRIGDAGEREPFLPSSPLLKAAGGGTSGRGGSSPSSSSSYIHLLQTQWARTKTHVTAMFHTMFQHTSDFNNNNNNNNNSNLNHQTQTSPHGGGSSSSSSSSINLPLLLLSFLLTSLASSDTKLLPQYISKRHDWRLASVGYLLSGKAVVNFVLLVFIVPRMLGRQREQHVPQTPIVISINNNNNNNRHSNDNDAADDTRGGRNEASLRAGTADAAATAAAASETRRNIAHARICLAVSLLGALLIAGAGSLVVLLPALGVYALGSALPVFTLSLLKSPFFVPGVGDAAAASVPATSATCGGSSRGGGSPDGERRDDVETGARRSQHDAAEHAVLGSPEEPMQSGSTSETQLFAVVMMVKTLGSLLGAPLMAALWVRGISIGGGALGIPYLVSAACYGAAIGVFAVMIAP